MKAENAKTRDLPKNLKMCITFHGHLCPGLVYGYQVGVAAAERLHISRSADEEVVAIAENDSCAIDGLQVILGTTAGKGNLTINNSGKSVYTVISRSKGKALRFSRRKDYEYKGSELAEFAALEEAFAAGAATPGQRKRQKHLKTMDLLSRPVEEIFTIQEVPFENPQLAQLAPSVACSCCGEMTMSTRMKKCADGSMVCQPCYDRLADR